MKRIYLISLGCPKNQVDSEVILGCLVRDGWVPTPTLEEADVAIVNTCAFLQAAVQESLETILEVVQEKEKGNVKQLVVTGCLPQRYGEEIVQELPEVDLWTGTGDFPEIPRWLKNGGPRSLIGNPTYLYDHTTPRLIANTPHSAYVKIAEGCSHPCTFCLIPRLRGGYRSRGMDSLVQEVRRLASAGVVEVNLVAQDTTYYGTDLGEQWGLWRLLERLHTIEGLRWIRILYGYPLVKNFPPGFLEMIAGGEKICPYLDLPIQHINDRILGRMGRRNSGREIRELVYRIKRDYPRIHLRTTLMVGFPGEGEDEFAELLDFVHDVEFSHLGVFPFSAEEGTRALRMEHKPPASVAEARAATIMELQQQISWRRNRAMVGSVIPVLVEGASDTMEAALYGRGAFQAPEVDGMIYIQGGKPHRGEIVLTRITQAGPYDLIGEIEAYG